MERELLLLLLLLLFYRPSGPATRPASHVTGRHGTAGLGDAALPNVSVRFMRRCVAATLSVDVASLCICVKSVDVTSLHTFVDAASLHVLRDAATPVTSWLVQRRVTRPARSGRLLQNVTLQNLIHSEPKLHQ